MQEKKYDVSVFIIDIENNYIELKEYKAYEYDNGIFICLTNDELNSDCGLFNNSICIYKDWREEVKQSKKLLNENYGVEYDKDRDCIWQIDRELIPYNERFNNNDDYNTSSQYYLDGYLSCQNIMSNVPSLLKEGETIQKYIPAIMTAHYTKVKHNGKFYSGYLPSIGQLVYTSKNVDKVNDALETLKRKSKQFKVYGDTRAISGKWWSSTQYHANYSCVSDAWFLCKGIPQIYFKNTSQRILPFFVV